MFCMIALAQPISWERRIIETPVNANIVYADVPRSSRYGKRKWLSFRVIL